MDNYLKGQPFIPVILGASIGVYSIARAFHEEYGIKSLSISRDIAGAIDHSAILDPIIAENMEEETVLASCLQDIANTYPDTPKILLGTDEWHIELIAGLKHSMGDDWVIPYPDKEIIDQVVDKTTFYDICHELDVDYPKYISLDEASLETDLPFPFPVVIKPTNRASYESIDFKGKRKVFTADDREELDDVLALIRKGGYTDNLIIQEFVPGDDTAMHILTLYIARDGEMQFAAFGQTLLEDHTPGGIGNPLVIRTERNDEVVEQAKRIVEHTGFVGGFANFDLKYDRRDGTYKFFELNPRLGRSNYYITAAGHNPVKYYVKDYIEKEAMPYRVAGQEVLYTVVPKRLLLNYISEPSLQQRIESLYKERKAMNPMFYFSVEKNLKRQFYVYASTMNFYRKFRNHPPENS